MQPQPLRDLMIKAGEKSRLLPPPERYLWSAVWWHLHSRETANPDECLRHAKGQLRLAKDMANRPAHYRRKPADKTDWEWSGCFTGEVYDDAEVIDGEISHRLSPDVKVEFVQ